MGCIWALPWISKGASQWMPTSRHPGCQAACFASRCLSWSHSVFGKSELGKLSESTMTLEDSGGIRPWALCLTWKARVQRAEATAHLCDSLCSETKGSTHWVTGTVPNDHGRVVCVAAFIVLLWFATVPCASLLPTLFCFPVWRRVSYLWKIFEDKCQTNTAPRLKEWHFPPIYSSIFPYTLWPLDLLSHSMESETEVQLWSACAGSVLGLLL